MSVIGPNENWGDSVAYPCLHCGAHSQQRRVKLFLGVGNEFTGLFIRECLVCESYTIWDEADVLIYPAGALAGPSPTEDMPVLVRKDFEEARKVAAISPRAAGALLRLALQRLCESILDEHGNLDHLIEELRRRDQISERVYRLMHTVRVVGNEAVHPGEMNLDESPKIVNQLFDVISFIISQLITKPKEEEALFASLPATKVANIRQREAKNAIAKANDKEE